MSEFLEIHGGKPLSGTVTVSGAKNAALPLLIASLLTPEPCELTNVPNLEDVDLTLRLLENFGARYEHHGDTIRVETPELKASEASYSLVKALRASFWVLGPLLARGRAARVALPGGDIIGARPVDMHLEALTKMGADIRLKHGVVYASAVDGLRPAEIDLRLPSVGATHQILMAAALTPGRTVIRGAAREPEIGALCDFLSGMGAEIEGAGSSTIVIRGSDSLRGASLRLIGDRIEAATFVLAACATGGEICVQGFDPIHFGDFLKILSDLGVTLDRGVDELSVKAENRLRPISVATGPFPALATDIQALLMAALTVADGTSRIEEHMFEGRFGHVSELCRMGANIRVEDHVASISGVEKLSGAPVEAFDIRAGAALVIAGLAAEGVTNISEPQHLRRGYSGLEQKVRQLGGSIGRKLRDPEDFIFAGC